MIKLAGVHSSYSVGSVQELLITSETLVLAQVRDLWGVSVLVEVLFVT